MKKLFAFIVLGSTAYLPADCGGNCGVFYAQPVQFVQPCDSCQWVNQPTTCQWANQPTTCQMANQPTTCQMANQPTTCQMANQPTTCQSQDSTTQSNTQAQTVNQPAPTATTGDEDINNDIKSTVGTGWFTKGYENVSFSVNNGVVTLTGSVNSQDDKDKLQDSLSKLKGVKQINNQILVVPQK